MANELFKELEARGLLEYGSFIADDLFHHMIGIEYPKTGTVEEFRKLQLIELDAVDSIRNKLLDEGKYIRAVAGGYRILLPSENAEQVKNYLKQANGKYQRAVRLSASSPVYSDQPDQTAARVMLLTTSIRNKFQ